MNSKEFGVGTRVWLGWTPDEKLMQHRWKAAEARCKAGTITGGPFRPGKHRGASGEEYDLLITCWNVDIDGVGEVFASENILYPMDGEPGLTEAARHTEKAVG